MLPRTLLIAPEPFAEGLDAQRAADAIARGVLAADAGLEVDLCPLEDGERDQAALKRYLEEVDFDVRMRAARALVVGAGRLDEATLLGSATFEIATRARQSGVPAYAVTGANALSAFDARILDLQVILQARDTRALKRAGTQLAELA
jgi:glycerate kinase